MSEKPNKRLSHVNEQGQANMVDVSHKSDSQRVAIAEGTINVNQETYAQIVNNNMSKGDVLSVARIAGIQGAKNCSNLIPLCHPLMLTKVQIDFEMQPENSAIRVLCTCKVKGNTGVEMEALSGVSIACLTLFDMCKALDPNMTIHSIRVLEKQGGKTGHWQNALNQSC